MRIQDVVVSPHLLIFMSCIAACRLNAEQRFTSEYRDLITGSRIDAWIYGHSHTNIDAEIGGTRIICNQMGYVFEDECRMNGFDPGKFFEIV